MAILMLTFFLTIGFAWYNGFTAYLYGQTIIPGFDLLPKVVVILLSMFVLDIVFIFIGYKAGVFLKAHLKGTEQWVAIITMFLIVFRMTYDLRSNIWQNRIEENVQVQPASYASLLSVMYALDLGCCACWLKCDIFLAMGVYIVVSILFYIFGLIAGYKKMFKTGYAVYQAATLLLFLAALMAIYYR